MQGKFCNSNFVGRSLLLAVLLCFVSGVFSDAKAGWYNGDWSYRMEVEIQNGKISSTVTNHPVYVDLDLIDATHDFWDNVKSDGCDIRITASDGTTEQPIELLNFVQSASDPAQDGDLYFKGASISSSSDTVFYLYYGNAGASCHGEGDTYGKHNVWDSNFKGVFHLEESSANTIDDSTSNNSDESTSVSSSATSATGRAGDAFDFNGSSDGIYFDSTSATNMSPTGALQVELWFDADVKGSDVLWYCRGDSTNKGHGVWFWSSYLRPSIGASGNIWTNVTYAMSSINTGQWYYYVANWDGATAKHFVDGTQQDSYSQGGSISYSGTQCTIGNRAGGDDFDGTIDEVRISNTARSQGYITATYNNISDPSTFIVFGAEEAAASPPVVSSYSPTDNGTNISTQANLVITFDQAVDAEAGASNNIVIKTTVGDTTVEDIDAQDAKVTGTGTTTITINPATQLENSTSYYVQIGADAFDNSGGDSYAGISDTTTWNFTTGVYNPVLSSSTPADGATAVSPSTDIVLVFNENIDTQTGNVTIKRLSDDVTVDTIDITDAAVTGNGTTTLTIDINGLDLNTSYYVNIDATAIDDTSSFSYAGISDNGTLNFTTDTDLFSKGWAYRAIVTLNGDLINGNHTDFPVYMDLDDMSAHFFTNTMTNGEDIRVTTSDKSTEVAVEVAAFNGTDTTGELYFRASSLTNGTDATFYIYYGNGDATLPAADSTYGSENVWNGGDYLGVWHLNEAVNNTASGYSDSTSNDYHGTGTGMNEAEVNGALAASKGQSFDGAIDEIDMGNISEMNSADDLTVSGWAKQDALDGIEWIFEKYASESDLLILYTWSDGFMYADCRTSGSNSWGYFDYSTEVTAGTWFKYDLVFNGAGATNADRLKLYIDGDPISLTYNSTIQTTAGAMSTAPVKLARAESGSYDSYEWDGQLDEFRILNGVSSADWINTEYNNQSSPDTFYTIQSQEANGAPTLSSSTPTDNGTDVMIGTDLILTFNEMVETNGSITIKKDSDDEIWDTVDLSTATTGNGTTTLTIDINGLELNTAYYVNIPAGNIKDLDGNNFAGITDKTTLSFTTSDDNWAYPTSPYREKITLTGSLINGSHTDFPVYVDLNGLPNAFFVNSSANGEDLRVADANGNFLAREIVAYDNAGTTGEMHFKTNLTDGVSSVFYIYYGSGEAEPAATSAYGSQNVWDSNYMMVQHMTGAAYTDLDDSTSNAHDVTVEAGDPSYNQTGQFEKAVTYDGTGDYVTVPHHANLDFDVGDSFSVSAWIKTSKTSGHSGIVNKWDTAEAGWHTFLLDSASKRRMTLQLNDGGNYKYVYGDTDLSDDVWHYVVASYDGTNTLAGMKVYVDGSEETTTDASSGTLSSLLTSQEVSIGARLTGAVLYFDGEIDEARVSDTVRSADWINTEYNNQSNPNFVQEGSYTEARPALSWINTAWTRKVAITLNGELINGSHSNFPVYVDLSNMPSSFFTDSGVNGQDIRVTDVTNTIELPREIVSFDNGASTGELHFKANSLTDATNGVFNIYYGNPAATEPAATDTYGSENVWDSSYAGVYHLNEDANTNVNGYTDSTSNDNHGTGGGMSDAAVTGKLSGQAQVFDGAADYIKLATGMLRFDGQFTIGAWAKPDTVSLNTTAIVGASDDGGVGDAYFVFLYRNDKSGLTLQWDDGPGGAFFPDNASSTQSVATWYHSVLVFDPVADDAYIYQDGVAVTSDTTFTTTPDETITQDWVIGSWVDTGGLYYDGVIDEVRIYNGNLSSDWINTEYNNQSSPSTFITMSAATLQNGSTVTEAAADTFIPLIFITECKPPRTKEACTAAIEKIFEPLMDNPARGLPVSDRSKLYMQLYSEEFAGLGLNVN